MVNEVTIQNFWIKDTYESKIHLLHTIGAEKKPDFSNFRNKENFTRKATIASTMPLKNQPLKLDLKMKMEPIDVQVYKPPQTAVTCQNKRGAAMADKLYSNLASSVNQTTRISSREANSSLRPGQRNQAVSLHSKAAKPSVKSPMGQIIGSDFEGS